MIFKGMTHELVDKENRPVISRALRDLNELNQWDFSDCYFHSIVTIGATDIDGNMQTGAKIRYSGDAKRKSLDTQP